MGKLADALEKAGYGDDGTERLHGQQVDEVEPEQVGGETEQSAELSAAGVAPSVQERAKPAPQPARKKRRSPAGSGQWDERLHAAVNNDPQMPELFKILRSRILHPSDGRAVPKTIMVTSAVPKEGKTFVTANLGISLAQGLDQHALLVDCDLRRPSLASLFGMTQRPGLADFLRDGFDLGDLIVKTQIDKLSLLPSGDPPVNPAELLGSARMNELVGELSSRYEDRFIIFDSPPFHAAAETAVLARRVDGVLLVVRAGGAGKPQLQLLLDTIGEERTLGVVFNAYTANVVERSLMKGYGYYQDTY
ncbi:polysaccharide biosynthesis tyrosine autokinase [bacterium]|nr:polysaccharide biosynthesis tyrosine autokinase [bacterium]